MKIKTASLLVLIISLASCSNTTTDKKVETTKEEKNETVHPKNELSLDNGKRWVANPETTEGINAMIQLMDSFSEQDNAASYKALSDSLESEFTLIFKRCTMKGEAHNQLHNFLFPMKAKFKDLASTDLAECKMTFDELKTHLAAYSSYFE